MIGLTLRNCARSLIKTNPPTNQANSGLVQPHGIRLQKNLVNINPTRNLVSGPPGRRVSLPYKIGFFVFFFLWLMVPEMAMVMAIPNHAGTSIEAIRLKMEEQEAMEKEQEEREKAEKEAAEQEKKKKK